MSNPGEIPNVYLAEMKMKSESSIESNIDTKDSLNQQREGFQVPILPAPLLTYSNQNQQIIFNITSQKSQQPSNNQSPEPESVSHLPPDLELAWVHRFILVQFITNLLVNVDMGILPACSLKVKEELSLDNSYFGALGSVVYFGQTIGSVLASPALMNYNPKIVLCTCLTLNISTLLIFTITNQYSLLLICRMCTGLFQVFFCIYFPVWADIYGNEQQKSKWLTYLLIAAPIGIVSGYSMSAAFLNNLGWRWAFYVQAVLMLPCMIIMFAIPSKYMDIKNTGRLIKIHQMKQIQFKQVQNKSAGSLEDIEIDAISDASQSTNKSKVSQNSDQRKHEDFLAHEEHIPLLKGLQMILANQNFTMMCIAITALFWVVTGFQYWASDYFLTELKTSPHTVYVGFGFVSITGPVLGCVIGGSLTTYLGGYNSYKSLYLTLMVSMVALVVSIPISFMDDFYIVLFLCWCLLFCGGFIMPNMTGILLNTVNQQLKTSANSIANFSYNMFGYLPAPFVFGLLSDSGKGNNLRIAMRVLTCVPIVTAIFLFTVSYNIHLYGFSNKNKQVPSNKQSLSADKQQEQESKRKRQLSKIKKSIELSAPTTIKSRVK